MLLPRQRRFPPGLAALLAPRHRGRIQSAAAWTPLPPRCQPQPSSAGSRALPRAGGKARYQVDVQDKAPTFHPGGEAVLLSRLPCVLAPCLKPDQCSERAGNSPCPVQRNLDPAQSRNRLRGALDSQAEKQNPFWAVRSAVESTAVLQVRNPCITSVCPNFGKTSAAAPTHTSSKIPVSEDSPPQRLPKRESWLAREETAPHSKCSCKIYIPQSRALSLVDQSLTHQGKGKRQTLEQPS